MSAASSLEALGMSKRTVEYHLISTKDKLACQSKSELIQAIIRLKLDKVLHYYAV